MSDERLAGGQTMTCDDVADFAGLYVLDALTADERRAVDAHLATCTQAHDEIRELGGVVPALASTATPVDAPAALKSRVMGAFEAEMASARPAATTPRVVSPPVASPALRAPRWRLPTWPAAASWATAIAAVLIIAVVGVWALGAQSRADDATRRAQLLADAVAALSQPGSSVATIHGTGSMTGATGFAAIPSGGRAGYLVMTGLPVAPSGRTYQAWYLVNGAPSSAGLMTVDADGLAVLLGSEPPPGTNLVALTIEPAGGSEQPTSAPFASGEVHVPS